MVTAAFAVVLLCVPAAATAATVPEAAQLTTEPPPDAGFGNAVATAGDLVVVSDVGDEKVHVYQRLEGAWPGVDDEPVATLFRPELPAGSGFGESVDISEDGSLIVVGAPRWDGVSRENLGRVYAFKRPAGGWSGNPEPYTADPRPPSERHDYFSDEPLTSNAAIHNNAQQGLRVLAAPDGSWLALLSNRYWQPGSHQELFDAGGKPSLISVFPLETTRPDSADRRLWVDGNIDAITALAVNDDGTTIFASQPAAWGVGYILAWNEPEGDWEEDGVFQAQEGEIASPIAIGGGARVGASLDAAGDWLVAGAPRASVGDVVQAGKAFVWKEPAGGWNKLPPLPTGPEPYDGIMPVATLTASDSVTMARFGQSVAILGDAIGVAAPGRTVGANANQGSAYVFREPGGGWAGEIDEEVAQFTASDGAAGDKLGSYDMSNTFNETGNNVALTGDALVASAGAQGKPTYVFEFKPRLSVSTGGGGSGTVSGGTISCPGTCESSEWLGGTVTLTATPDAGSEFTGWSGACTGTGTCEVTMEDAREVTANFVGLPPHEARLAVAVNGQGSVSGDGIDCPGTCELSKPVGSTVTLSATPATGWVFGGWEGGGCSGTGECAVTLSGDRDVRATFFSQMPSDGAGGTQPPAGLPANPPSGPGAQPRKPLKCKKGFVKKWKKGKARCVKRKKKRQRVRAGGGRNTFFILESSINHSW